MKELSHRIWMGAIGICLLILGLILLEEVWFPPIVAAALAVLASIGYGEYCQFARLKGLQPAVVIGVVGAWVYIAVRLLGIYPAIQVGMPVGIAEAAVLFLTAVAMLIHCLLQYKQALLNLAVSAFGFVYVTVPLALAIDILYYLPREIAIDGRWWIVFILGVTVFTDMGAYFVGKALGKTPLAPRISPGKSVEGSLGGVVIGVVAGVIIYLFHGHSLGWWPLILLSLCMAVLGQMGDLTESLFKRDAGVKDSGRLPGLGGVLDIIDSLLVTIPFIYIVLRWTAEVAA